VQGSRTPWEHAIGGTAILVVLAIWLAPAAPTAEQKARQAAAAAQPVTMAQLRPVIEQRCAACHNAQLATKNVALHTPELLRQHAQAVYQQAVVLKLMPMNNATGITDDERDLIRRWFEAGARVD
jgi:uncharacterized membrane protein